MGEAAKPGLFLARQGKTGFALGRFEVGCEVLVVVLTAGMPGSFVSNPVLLRETRRR